MVNNKPAGALAEGERIVKERRYVLVTPACDEEKFIGKTISSVAGQTILPLQWVMVNDGSRDRTGEIVAEAAKTYPWIRSVHRPPNNKRGFDSVVYATEAGIQSLSVTDYLYIGLLDADVRFGQGYFEELMARFESSPRLGLAGGMVVDVWAAFIRPPRNRLDIPGATQFFRRECFESLDGLIPIPEGGWDVLTCARVRMLGYETKLFTDIVVHHLKPRNVSQGGILRRSWNMGIRDRSLGYLPMFEILKCLDRLGDRPIVLGSFAWMAGYFIAFIRRKSTCVAPDLLRFMRLEQRNRIRKVFINLIRKDQEVPTARPG